MQLADRVIVDAHLGDTQVFFAEHLALHKSCIASVQERRTGRETGAGMTTAAWKRRTAVTIAGRWDPARSERSVTGSAVVKQNSIPQKNEISA